MGAVRIGVLIFLSLSTLPAASLVERALDSLQWRNPLPQGNDLFSAAYGNGRYVIVGRRGVILTSLDGAHWTVRNDRRTNDLVRVTFADGKFVAVGTFGGIFVSTDGLEWQNRSVSIVGSIREASLITVAYGNGTWVVGAWEEGHVFTSTNALEWSGYRVSWNFLEDMTFGAGRFLTASAYTSTNGRDWSRVTLPSTPLGLHSVAYGNGRFVIAGSSYIATSVDGFNWTEGTATGYSGDIAAGPGVFARLQSNGGSWRYNRLFGERIFRSTDGLSWTPVLIFNNYIYGLAFAGDRFLAVGNNGVFFTSPDAVTWTQASYATENNFRAVAHGDGGYVAVGNEGTVFTSDDGSQWTRQPPVGTNNLRGVVHAEGAFFAASGEDILRSTDGTVWSYSYDGEDEDEDYELLNIAHVGNTFIAVGHSGTVAIYTSNRFAGRFWHLLPTPTRERLQGVTYGNGLFVVTGDNGIILTSPDTLRWTLRPSGTNVYLQAAAYGNGRFVAVGAGRVFSTSEDGLNWATHPKPLEDEYEHIIFAAGHFVIVGEDGTLLSSTNGLNWTQHYSGSHNNLRYLLYARGAFTIVGNNDAILQSAQVLPLLHVTRDIDGVELRVRAMPDTLYRLQASPDLRSWSDLFIFQNSQENTVFFDSEAADHDHRFYRVAFEP